MTEYIDMLKGFVGDVDPSVLQDLGEKATSVFKGIGKTDDFINTVQTNRLAESATAVGDSPILKDAFMNIALKDKPITPFNSYGSGSDKTPPVIRGFWWGGESFFTDKISGKLATEYTPSETKEENVITNPHNILYWINKSDLIASRPGIGISDGQYKNWEASFQSWIQTHGLGDIRPAPQKPTQTDDVHRPEFEPTVIVNQPIANTSVTLNQDVSISTSASGPRPIKKFEFYVNDQFIGSVDGETANYSFVPADYVTIPGVIQLRVVAVDTVYNKGEQIIQLNVQ